MTAHLYNHKISYFSVPKCACTSLKNFFFEIQNGFAFKNFKIDRDDYHLHRFYISRPFEVSQKKSPADHKKYTLIRDPLSRLVSCYRNRVDSAQGRNLMRAQAENIKAKKLPLHPTWPEFLEHLDMYRDLVPMLKHHSEPLSHFLGTDPEYFDGIFSISDMNSFVQVISDQVGDVPAMQRFQSHGTDFNSKMVTPGERKKIDEIFSEDHEIFGKYF